MRMPAQAGMARERVCPVQAAMRMAAFLRLRPARSWSAMALYVDSSRPVCAQRSSLTVVRIELEQLFRPERYRSGLLDTPL